MWLQKYKTCGDAGGRGSNSQGPYLCEEFYSYLRDYTGWYGLKHMLPQLVGGIYKLQQNVATDDSRTAV